MAQTDIARKPKVDAGRFKEALEQLKVETSREGEAFVVTIDLSPVTSLVRGPFPENERIEFRLDPTQELIVSRPAALALTRTKYWLISDARYAWQGGVPQGRSFAPPGAGNSRDEQSNLAPVMAVVRRLVFEAGLMGEYRREAEEVATQLWKAVWRAIGPNMNRHALSHANRFGLEWDRYRMLHQRPDLCTFLDSAPGIGPRIHELPADMSWEDKVVRLVGYCERRPNGDYEYLGRNSAFLTWVRKVPYSKEILPVFKIARSLAYKKQPDAPGWELMLRMARATEAGCVRAEEIERLETPLQWLIFHTAIVHGHDWYARLVCNDPAAAEKAFLRTFAPVRKPLAKWVAAGLERMDMWEHHAKWAAEDGKVWAERVGRPDLAPSIPSESLRRMDVVCRRVRRLEALERRFRLTQYNRADFAMSAPVRLIELAITRPEFKWNEKVYEALLNRRGCRKNPTIRRFLIERAETPHSLVRLLEDGVPSETLGLWKRLAALSPEEAIEYLEKRGFDPQVDWKPEDLAILFKGGQKIVIRAILLLSDLPRMLEDQKTMARENGSRAGRSL